MVVIYGLQSHALGLGLSRGCLLRGLISSYSFLGTCWAAMHSASGCRVWGLEVRM